MTFADRRKPMLRRVRAIPGRFGLRVHQVFMKNVVWTGTSVKAPGDGSPNVVEVEINENGHPPKVRQASDQRVALGEVAKGALDIGPITTPSETVGLTAEHFRGVNLQDLEQLYVRVEGPLGNARYTIASLRMDHAMHWNMTVEPRGEGHGA